MAHLAAGTARVKGARRLGVRTGNRKLAMEAADNGGVRQDLEDAPCDHLGIRIQS
jgi:hypothetical protein